MLQSTRTAVVTISDIEGKSTVSFVINQEAVARTLAVSPESMTFSALGGEEMISISSNTDWTVGKDTDWIALDSDKGNGDSTIKIIVAENKALTSRTGSITVTSADGKIKGTVSIQQNGADVVFSIDRQEVSVNAAGEDFTVNVTHNIGYKINSMPDWVKQTDKATSGDTDTYTFKAEANTSTATREGVIVFCNDNNECVPVTVKQAGANTTLSVSPVSMTFTAKAESKTFTVTSNTDWTATSDADWAKLSATGGSGNAQVTVTAEENTTTKQRIAAITLKTKDGKTTATIKLSQNGADIIFRTDGDNREYEIGAEGGEIQFFVIHNIECYLKELPEWIILDNMQTYDGATWYKFIIIPNTSTSERGGHIVIRGLAENEYDLPILVIQAAGKPKGGNENTTTGEEITIE